MKKILLAFSFSLLLSPLSSYAEVLYSESVTLTPGWNIVSTPRILESHSFSAPETTENFDVFVLNASSTASWSTLADIGQTEFMPLYGYFINNKSSSTQTLTFNYKANIEPNERLFERTFSKAGWYSIGVANPTYAKSALAATTTDSNNPSRILNSLSGGYDSALDLTDESYASAPSSVAVGSAWKQGVSSDVDSLNDLRETKGYVVYIRQAGALYSGFQDNTLPATTTVPVTPPAPTLVPASFSITSGFVAATTSPNTSLVKIASFTLEANTSEDINLNAVGFSVTLSNPASANVSNFVLLIGTDPSPAIPLSTGTTTISFPDIVIPVNGNKKIDLYADFGPDTGNTVTVDMEVRYTGATSTVQTILSAPGVGITPMVDNSGLPI